MAARQVENVRPKWNKSNTVSVFYPPPVGEGGF